MKLRQVAAITAVASVLSALFTPNLPAIAAYNFPSAFGPISGDCTTPSPASPVITCTKSNGQSFASMAFQAASAVAITGGSINGTSVGATTPSTGAFTTGSFTGALSGAAASFSGALSGVGNTFTGFSSQTGGHQVGTVTLTATATLTQAQESVCTNATAAITVTLPASPVEGQRIDLSDCGGQAGTNNVTVVGSGGVKVNYSTSGLVYTVNFQSATFTYRSAFGWIVT